MSESSPRGRSRSSSKGKSPTPYDKDELAKKTVTELKKICSDSGIDITDVKLKQEIIDRMLGRTSYSGEASARSRSPRASSPGRASVSFTKTLSAKKSPERRTDSASAARGGQSEADDFASLTAGSIAEMSAPKANAQRKKQWEAIYKPSHQPWDNLTYLKRGVLTRMMPENPEYVDNPLFVVNIGAAGVGKSNGPFALGLRCNNTLVLNPDEWYEFFAIMFGYKPPVEDSTWWGTNKDNFGQYETVIPSEGITRVTTRPVASEFCSPKVHCLSAYPKMLREVKDFIFEQALDKSSSKFRPRGLNIVFDSTGSMEEVIGEYITKAQSFGYKIVIVGVYSTLRNCIGRVDQGALRTWKFDSEEVAANMSADSWRPVPGKQITRPDIPAVAGGGAAAGAVSCRNKLQHRKLVAFGLKSAWDTVRDKVVIFKWVAQARDNGWRIVLVENNLSSANPSGGVGIIYDEDKETPFVQKGVDSDPTTTVSALFRPTGFYGMKLGEGGNFFGRAEVEAAAAKAKAAAEASKRSRDGGSSRKRRISRRRIHGSRARKTIKKYSRPLTRRRRHRHCSISFM